MVILTPDQSSADEMLARTMDRCDSSSLHVIAMGRRTPTDAVAETRAEHGGAPLGVLAASDAEALEAIAAGADEALHFATVGAGDVHLLLDRTGQRAALRQSGENELTSAVQSEKLAALGTVVAGVAHEINNPLAAILLSTELLRSSLGPLFDMGGQVTRLAEEGRAASADEMMQLAVLANAGGPPGEGREVLDELTSLAETIAAVVKDLRIFARSDENEAPQVVQVVDLIEQVLRIVGREITSHGNLERDYGSDLPPLLVPRSRVVQVLTNVLVNAAHAIREMPRAARRVRISVRADGEAVAISVSDTGPGIAPEAVERIFDPFYTTKREGAGTGLGLSISRSILRRLGGDLIVESVHGVGDTFVALVPLPTREAMREAMRRSSPSMRSSGVRPRRLAVLVVDDDEHLLRVYPRILRERYDVIVAEGGQEAIDLLSSGSEVDVVVSDHVMPHVDGLALLAWLARERPELAQRTIFVSAAAGQAPYHELLARLPNAVLDKPVARADLFEAIDGVLEGSLDGRLRA